MTRNLYILYRTASRRPSIIRAKEVVVTKVQKVELNLVLAIFFLGVWLGMFLGNIL